MSTERELDDGIKSIRSAWRRKHTARKNLEKMLENAEVENARLRELARDAMKSACAGCPHTKTWRSCEGCNLYERATKLGMEVES